MQIKFLMPKPITDKEIANTFLLVLFRMKKCTVKNVIRIFLSDQIFIRYLNITLLKITVLNEFYLFNSLSFNQFHRISVYFWTLNNRKYFN